MLSLANDKWSRDVTIHHGCVGLTRSVPIGMIRRHLHPPATLPWIFCKSVANWGRSAYIFSTHHNTAIKIFYVYHELTNGHQISPSVTVVTGRRDLSRSGRSTDIFTKSIANWQTVTKWHHHDDPPTCPKLTQKDEPLRSVTDRHQFGDPLRIGCIGQPS